MKDYRLSKKEQETIITFDNDSPNANIFSCAPGWVSKIKKLDGWKPCDDGVEVDVPKAWIKIAKPATRTTAQREAARKNMAKLRSKK